MLLDSAFNFDAPDPVVGWRVFKRFVELPVTDVADGVLWQVGCYDSAGARLCYLDYVRQFEFTEDGEFDHFEQLHLEFTTRPSAALASIKRNRWAFDFPALADFFDEVESFPEFQIATRHSQWQVALWQEQV